MSTGTGGQEQAYEGVLGQALRDVSVQKCGFGRQRDS